MPAYAPEPESTTGRGQGRLAVAFVILALATSYLPEGAQQTIAGALRVSVLRPFVATQERLGNARLRASQVDALQSQLDSLTVILATQGALAHENETLRDLLALEQRTGPSFVPATIIRPGTPGSESMFLIELGSDHGIRAGAPVVGLHGLVGRIREVRPAMSVGMDWTHPDFRASAMLEDGSMNGMVEVRRGSFREDDRLVLNGTAYHENAAVGTLVLTSGLGGIFPRGIPIGAIDTVESTQGNWRKSYWLRPMVEPGSVTHVLVATSAAGDDVRAFWAQSDSLAAEQGAGPPEPGR